MPKLKRLTQRQEVFARHIASGLSGVEAFKRVTPGNPRDCDSKANQMRRHPAVEQRIRELMRENAQGAKFTRERAIEWLERVITTGAGDVRPHDPLCQSHKHTTGDGWESHEVKIPDKLGAMQTLCRMCDWFSPEKISVSSDSLSSYLLQLRSQRLLGGSFNVAGERAAPIELENGANGENYPVQGAGGVK
jgi:hypothetical protein